MNNNDILTLKNWIKESKKIVVFSGAGISVPSGIPDFSAIITSCCCISEV